MPPQTRLLDLPAALPDPPAAQPVRSQDGTDELHHGGPRRGVRRVLVALGALAVVLVHFRPYQRGMLEDWLLALAWEQEGIGGFFARLPATIGRPLHLVPHYLGLVISDGGFAGPFAVLALVAVGQLLLAMWALRPVTDRWALRWGLSLLLALHPWWPAGDVLRFMPAQVSVLTTVVWLGAAVRWLRGGCRWWLGLVVVAPVLGLLTYQAPALALLGALVAVVAVVGAGRARAAVLAVATVAGVVSALAWSAVLAPMIVPNSYEAQLLDGDAGGPLHLLRLALRTLVLFGPQVLVLVGLVAVVVIALGLAGRLSPWRVWVLLAVVGGAPLGSLVYGSAPLQLNDPERLVLPVGLLAWVVLAVVAGGVGRMPRVRRALIAGSLVVSVAGSVLGFAQWAGYSSAQGQLIRAASSALDQLPAGTHLVVADHGGRYGDVYLLLPPHLGYALEQERGDGIDTVLCTPAGTVRDQPAAARFPIATTPDCAPLLEAPGTVRLGEVPTELGDLEMFAVPDSAG